MLSLRQAFGGTVAERRAVARSVDDLAADGRLQTDLGIEVTPTVVIENLGDAPDGTPAERWNWWLGALEAAYGGYYEFRVTAWEQD